MLKKLSILFSIALIALGVNAQLPVGGWTFHPTFTGITSVAETQSMVFYLSGSSLYSIDKKTRETRSLNSANDLNDAGITAVYSQPEGKYIIVVYSSSNMDRVNDDGSVVNISDIKDANINSKIGIKHVGFGKGKFYVSTDFGLVTFDEKKSEARETMFTPAAVTCAYGLADKVIISYGNKLMAADANKKLVSLDQFSLIGGNQTSYTLSNKGVPVGDNRLLLVTTGNAPLVAHFDFENDKLIYFGNASISGVKGVFNMGTDQAIAYNGTQAVVYNNTDNPASPTKLTLPSMVQNHMISARTGWNHTWGGNAAGIAECDLSDFTAPVQLCDKFGATDFTTVQCCRIFSQPNGELYFWNPYTELGAQFGNFGTNTNLKLDSYSTEDGFADITPTKQASGAAMGAISGTMWVCQDPKNPDRFYITTWSKGIYVVENGVVVSTINNTNSAISMAIGSRVTYAGFDKFNNFWVTQETLNPVNNIHVVSYEDLTSGNMTADMWKSYYMNSYRSIVGTALNHSGRMAFFRGRWNDGLIVMDQKGTASIDDDELIHVINFVDQDNKAWNAGMWGAMTEDAKGRLWIGTDNGIVEITDPSKINSETVVINHLKVPRNDGTGLADYLLDSQMTSDIAIDNSNRKWVSTTTNGVYLISENGDEILENFTTENSCLPSNRVWSVACDPNSSSVFFATDAGVVEYNSTSSPAMTNFDNVYAFPNPVRPEYSGWITVTGLMDNSLVKIADAAGNVLFQGRSEGGMIIWDGCNANGDRVKTGVYYVFASNGTATDSSSESCVTKILVVN